ncbi:hypothetical protein QUF54_07360, partial [Candidatus Marithioploca araucensis]|nr:hypothetical protein [Candidatus Marithioploca araucensis]
MVTNNTTSHKIPLTIGITGHRDLREEDKDILRESVRKIFQLLHKRYPNSPLQLLSPLAEGADRLVAEVALAENVQLLVPLPMSQDLYEIDFQTATSKEEFEALLAQATQVFELSLLEGNTPENIRQYGNARSKQYALAGAYIARHSLMLLALWDGIPLNKSAGTSEVVQFKLTGDMKDLPKRYKPQYGHLDIADTGPVFHVMTSRESGHPLDTVGETRVLLPNCESKKHLEDWHSSDLEAINRFNQDVETYSPQLQSAIKNGQQHLLSEKLSKNLFELSPAFQTMLGVYGTANALARHFQSRFQLFTKLVLMLAAGMVGCYGWYTSINPHLITLTGYFVLFIAAAGIFHFVKWQHYHNKNLDYRALAEGLRVQIFWHLGGLIDSVADHYLRKQRDELIWIRGAIRAVNLYDWVENVDSIDNVHSHWVEHQHDWFSKNAPKNHHHAQKMRVVINRLFLLGGFLVLGLLLGQFTNTLQSDFLWHQILILLIALIPATGALLHHYTEKMAFEEHAKQYERMTALFTRASKALEPIMLKLRQVKNDPVMTEKHQKEAREELFELGKEALEENGD